MVFHACTSQLRPAIGLSDPKTIEEASNCVPPTSHSILQASQTFAAIEQLTICAQLHSRHSPKEIEASVGTRRCSREPSHTNNKLLRLIYNVLHSLFKRAI